MVYLQVLIQNDSAANPILVLLPYGVLVPYCTLAYQIKSPPRSCTRCSMQCYHCPSYIQVSLLCPKYTVVTRELESTPYFVRVQGVYLA